MAIIDLSWPKFIKPNASLNYKLVTCFFIYFKRIFNISKRTRHITLIRVHSHLKGLKCVLLTRAYNFTNFIRK